MVNRNQIGEGGSVMRERREDPNLAEKIDELMRTALDTAEIIEVK
jgi:hypothetical protein